MQKKLWGAVGVVLFLLLVVMAIASILLYNPKGKHTLTTQKEPIPSSEIKENSVSSENNASSDQLWNKLWSIHTSSQGISFKYPKQILGLDRCSNKEFYVGTKVFEDKDKGIIYIAPEYYYDYQNSNLTNEDGSLNTNQPCQKFTNSLDWIKKSTANDTAYGPLDNIIGGLNIAVRDVKNGEELKKFVKDMFGSECEIDADTIETNANDIKVKSTDMEGNCPMNFAYKISYDQEKNKAIAVNLGQDCNMSNISDVSSAGYECYPFEIADSIKFN